MEISVIRPDKIQSLKFKHRDGDLIIDYAFFKEDLMIFTFNNFDSKETGFYFVRFNPDIDIDDITIEHDNADLVQKVVKHSGDGCDSFGSNLLICRITQTISVRSDDDIKSYQVVIREGKADVSSPESTELLPGEITDELVDSINKSFFGAAIQINANTIQYGAYHPINPPCLHTWLLKNIPELEWLTPGDIAQMIKLL